MKIFEGENENMVFVYKVVKQKSSGMRYIGGYIIILIVFVLFASVLSKLSISHEHNNSGLVLPLATVLLLIIYFLTKRHRERAFDFEDMGRITFTKDKVYLDNGATMSFNYSQLYSIKLKKGFLYYGPLDKYADVLTYKLTLVEKSKKESVFEILELPEKEPDLTTETYLEPFSIFVILESIPPAYRPILFMQKWRQTELVTKKGKSVV